MSNKREKKSLPIARKKKTNHNTDKLENKNKKFDHQKETESAKNKREENK